LGKKSDVIIVRGNHIGGVMNGKIDEKVKLRGLRGGRRMPVRVRVRVTSGYDLYLNV